MFQKSSDHSSCDGDSRFFGGSDLHLVQEEEYSNKTSAGKTPKIVTFHLAEDYIVEAYISIIRAHIGDPIKFLGQRIAKKHDHYIKTGLLNSWNRGVVRDILYLEGINTIFLVEWEDGTREDLYLIDSYLRGKVWLIKPINPGAVLGEGVHVKSDEAP